MDSIAVAHSLRWLAWLPVLFGIGSIVWSRRFARNAVATRFWGRFIIDKRRRLEEDEVRRIYVGAGMLLICLGLWILIRP
jgi:hypothetical protein